MMSARTRRGNVPLLVPHLGISAGEIFVLFYSSITEASTYCEDLQHVAARKEIRNAPRGEQHEHLLAQTGQHSRRTSINPTALSWREALGHARLSIDVGSELFSKCMTDMFSFPVDFRCYMQMSCLSSLLPSVQLYTNNSYFQ